MNRSVTNVLRYILDDYLPPVVRDNYYLMYPIFRYWFAGTDDIGAVMRFKEFVHAMSEAEFADFNAKVKWRRKGRQTDASEPSLQWVLDRLDPGAHSLLDVGCGGGHWLNMCAGRGLELAGCDLGDKADLANGTYHCGNAEALPFPDKAFDVVTCFHVLEHVRRLDRAIAELKRVAKRQICLIVPCQRYYKYTLDLHVHFFYSPSYFRSLLGIEQSRSELIRSWFGAGDLVYVADVARNAVPRPHYQSNRAVNGIDAAAAELQQHTRP